MNKIKQAYNRPTTEILVIRFEEGILNTSGPGSGYNRSGGAGNEMNEDPDYNYSF